MKINEGNLSGSVGKVKERAKEMEERAKLKKSLNIVLSSFPAYNYQTIVNAGNYWMKVGELVK